MNTMKLFSKAIKDIPPSQYFPTIIVLEFPIMIFLSLGSSSPDSNHCVEAKAIRIAEYFQSKKRQAISSAQKNNKEKRTIEWATDDTLNSRTSGGASNQAANHLMLITDF